MYRTIYRVIPFFWLLISIPILNFSQHDASLRFTTYGVKDGLPGASVGEVLQDKLGYIWIGADGLVRFDGHAFKNFLHQPGVTGSLSSNYVSELIQDQHGYIWLGTRGGGLNRFDPKTEQFRVYRKEENNPQSIAEDYVTSLFLDHQDRLWVGTTAGVCMLQEVEKGIFIRYNSGDDLYLKLNSHEISGICEYPPGVIWLTSDRAGLFRLNSKDSSLTQYIPQNDDPGSLAGYICKHVNIDQHTGQPELWIATFNGLDHVALTTEGWPQGGFIHFRHAEEDSLSLPSSQLSHFMRDSDGTLWVGTRKAGLAMQVDAARFLHFSKESGHLPANFITHIHEDAEGLIWVSTEGGLVRIRKPNKRFKHHQFPLHAGVPGNINSIILLKVDSKNRLWVGSEGEGLRRMNSDMTVNQVFGTKTPVNQALVHSIPTTMVENEDGSFWVATFGGLTHFFPDDSTQSSRHFQKDPQNANSLSDNHIFCLYQDKQDHLWIGTRGGGLNHYNPKNDSFQHFMHIPNSPESLGNNYVWSIISDGKEGLWIATDAGVDHMVKKDGKYVFSHHGHDPAFPQSLSNNYVNFLHRSTKGQLWVGTSGGGLNRLDSLVDGKAFFSHFRLRDGLANEVIYAILEDKSDNLWISTDHGISRLSFDQEGFEFRNFDTYDGLQGDEFNMGAYAMDAQGQLFFGGMNGWNSFFPDSMVLVKRTAPARISEVKIVNEIISANQKRPYGNVPMQSSAAYASEIELSHRDYVLTLEFAKLSFSEPAQHRYAYKLDGFDEDWNFVKNRFSATYTNLDPGYYTFHLRGADADGLWSEAEPLRIHVNPPPWRSWWAYMLYAIAFVSLIYGYIRFRVAQHRREIETSARIERAKTEEREDMRRKSAADFHDELGNKLTKINLFMTLARRKAGAESPVSEILDKVESYTSRLSEGVRDLIWGLDPSKDSLYESLARLKDFGDQLFEYTDITFRMEGLKLDWEQIPIPLDDRRHLLLIFKEAMHNALKYAEASEVTLASQFIDNQLSITLSDNGKGFEMENIEKGYGLDNMRRRAEQMRGELQIQSAMGKGTSVMLVWGL